VTYLHPSLIVFDLAALPFKDGISFSPTDFNGACVWDSGYRVQGSGFRVQGPGFRVQGSGFRVQGSGCRVQGSGL